MEKRLSIKSTPTSWPVRVITSIFLYVWIYVFIRNPESWMILLGLILVTAATTIAEMRLSLKRISNSVLDTNWARIVFGVIFICAIINMFVHPEGNVEAVGMFAVGGVFLCTFVPSYLVIDYDNDILEVKLCEFWGYELRHRRGLSNAKTIKVELDSGGDSGYTIKKYLVFSDGEEIELPETDNIELVLRRWYKQYFHVQLPILKRGFSKGLLEKLK
jgi:hypothetical protein